MPRTIDIEIPPFGLNAMLTLPMTGLGLVLFAHGSGSGRFSPRNQYVARGLQEAGLGTLLFDLLTDRESIDRRNVFNIDMLADRLVIATDHVAKRDETRGMPIGYFGASTGAAAALIAATRTPHPIGAIVSRGGRPDLAGAALDLLRVPTLLIVGGLDDGVIDLNAEAHARLGGEKRLEIVPGAGHLFEEPGMLDQVIALARDWFTLHLRSAP